MGSYAEVEGEIDIGLAASWSALQAVQPERHVLIANGVSLRNRLRTLFVRREALFSYPPGESEPAKAIEPVENTAPPPGVS